MKCRTISAAVALAIASTAFSEPLVDLAKADFRGATRSLGGVKFDLDMGTQHVNWTNARWSVLNFEAPKDLSKFSGLKITVTTETPRSDAGVYIAVKEASGAWYYLPWAADLTQNRNTSVARFEDFSTADYVAPPGGSFTDANGKLDLDQVAAIAVGCVNSKGVGQVSFTVTSLETIPLVPTEKGPATSVRVTGKLIDINGTSCLPAGLFGGFNLKEMEAGANNIPRVAYYRLAQDRRINPAGPVSSDVVTNIMINTLGDRIGASMRLSDPAWQQTVAAQGAKYGEAAKTSGKKVYVEWWNEPYLNWANINRRNFDPKFYDESRAVEGGPVTLKIDGSDMPHLKWTQKFPVPGFNWCDDLQQFRRGKDAKGEWSLPYAMPYAKWTPPKWRQAAALQNPPDRVKDGEKYTAEVKSKPTDAKGKSVDYTAFTPWTVYDETQFTYWSGRGMLRAYIDPMLAFAKPFKETGGDKATLIAGWGTRPSEDHWAGFTQLYQPTIDAGIQYIDGICDHDYGGDPRKMPANYELITAYGVTKYHKWLYAYNTETAMGGDPQAYAGAAGGPSGTSFDRAKFNWLATKLLHTLATVPDKARTFAWFGMGGGWFSDTGEGQALLLLKNLRGQLVQVENSDPNVYIVAAIDGTDPDNPRPVDMPQRKELVVAILNDAQVARALNVKVAAPQGMRFDQVIIRHLETDPAAGLKIVEKTAPAPADYTFQQEFQPKDLVVLTFPLAGEFHGKPSVTQRQFFSKELLAEVTPDKPSQQSIDIPADALSGASKAWLTFVAERLNHDAGLLTLNGKEYTLPAAPTPENTAWLRKVPLDLADVKPANALLFKASPGNAGYLLPTASIVVEK